MEPKRKRVLNGEKLEAADAKPSDLPLSRLKFG